jgi:hypothetical protein
MKYKDLSDEQLEAIGKEMSQVLTSWAEIWSQSMKGLKINSPEYQAICKAGKKIQQAYMKMRIVAEDRHWPESKRQEVFTVTTAYGFT